MGNYKMKEPLDVAEMRNNSFGNRLKSALGQRNITQIGLSEMTGISKTNINRYVQDEFEPNCTSLRLICNALEISADWLLGLKE